MIVKHGDAHKLCDCCKRDYDYGFGINHNCPKCSFMWPALALDLHYADMANQVNDLFASEYKYLGAGWSRRTYDLGNGIVAKIPNGDDPAFIQTFFNCNLDEEEFSKNGHPDNYPCAETFGVQDWYGVPVLYMEKVTPLKDAQKAWHSSPDYDGDYNKWPWNDGVKPNWLDRLQDGLQVGITSKGKIVSYDFATNI